MIADLLVAILTFQSAHPFAGRSFDDILSAHVVADQPRWKSYSHGARLLVQRLLVRDPAQRPAAASLLADPWLADVQPPPPADPASFVRVPPPVRVRETVELPPEPEQTPSRHASATTAAAAAAPSKQRSTASASGSTKRAREEPAAEEKASAAAAAVAAAAPAEKKTKEAAAETEESLSALKVVDLKARCKELGLAVGGRKAELVARILEHLSE
jgi:hypothetical protein